MEKLYIKSVSEFITAIFEKIKSFEPENRKVIWFRGQADETYKLTPNLYRDPTKTKLPVSIIQTPKSVFNLERNIDSSFYRKSVIYLSKNGIKNTHWNRYFLKQHYFNLTRLLDWTESALIALFFAVSGNETEKDKVPKVWILSPLELNSYSISKLIGNENYDTSHRAILSCGNSKLKKTKNLINKNGAVDYSQLLTKYYTMNFNPGENGYPLAIYPLHLDDRMAAQQACFTVFGNIIKGLEPENIKNKFLESVYIAKDKKSDILEELRFLGITEYTILPDLDGLGKSITSFSLPEVYKMHSDNNISNLMSFMSPPK